MTPRIATSPLLRGIAPLLYALAAVAPPGSAAAGSERGAECAAVDEPAARLACYDKAFPRPTAAGRVVAPVVAPAVRPAGEAEKFGLSERQRAEREPRPETPPATTVTAAVTSVRKLPSGYLLVDLDNQQRWQQIEPSPNLYLRVGESVTIRKAALGSFLLVTRSNHSTRVRRVQ